MRKLGISVVVFVSALLVLRFVLLQERLSAPIPPAPPDFQVEPIQSESTFLVTAAVSLAALEQLAERSIPLEYRDRDSNPTNALYNDSASVRVRRGPLRLRPSSGGLLLEVPIVDGSGNIEGRFGARGWLGERVASTPVSATVRDLRGQFTARMTPVLSSDWTIDPRIDANLNLSNADLRVRHVGNISMRGYVEDMFKDEKKKQLKKLNGFLGNAQLIQSAIEPHWKSGFVTQKLDDAGTWGMVRPTAVLAGPIVTDERDLYIAVGIKVLGSIIFSEEAPANEPTPLPPLTIVGAPEPEISVRLPIGIEYTTASAQLDALLEGQVLELEEFPVEISHVALRPDGNRLRLVLEIEAKEGLLERTTARFTLAARPHIDRDAQTLSLVDLEMDVATRNYLIETADWLANPAILSWIEQRAKLNLDELEAELRDSAIAMVKAHQAKLPANVKASFDLDRARVTDLRVTPDRLVVVFSADGQLAIDVEHLPVAEGS